jgi:hypothetical protein
MRFAIRVVNGMVAREFTTHDGSTAERWFTGSGGARSTVMCGRSESSPSLTLRIPRNGLIPESSHRARWPTKRTRKRGTIRVDRAVPKSDHTMRAAGQSRRSEGQTSIRHPQAQTGQFFTVGPRQFGVRIGQGGPPRPERIAHIGLCPTPEGPAPAQYNSASSTRRTRRQKRATRGSSRHPHPAAQASTKPQVTAPDGISGPHRPRPRATRADLEDMSIDVPASGFRDPE